MRRFCPSWFNEFGNRLEYNIKKRRRIFFLCCYIFRPNFGKQFGGDTLITERFISWNKKSHSHHMLEVAIILLTI